MLSEVFIAATETVRPPATHLSSQLKDAGVFIYQLQPQAKIQQGFKKSSASKNCIAYSDTHIFAAQAGKAVINVYNRSKGNQEATVPFPQKITSLAYAAQSALVILGTQDGMLMLWEIGTGRVTSSTPSHVEAVTQLVVTPDGAHIVSGSHDATVHVWSIPRLVSFERSNNELDLGIRNAPIGTWTQHRTAITSLAVGHSKNLATNFVVSTSDDKTCYIWSLDKLQLLRTLILAETAQCVTLDPADRVIYFGGDDGSVQDIHLFALQVKSTQSLVSTSAEDASAPIQLSTSRKWVTPTDAGPGAAHCMTLSYDGTMLLTGHSSGKILRWEVAKRRLAGETSTLTGQPVTNMSMLPPTGFVVQDRTTVTVPAVIKPRLDLNTAGSLESSSALPVDYDLHVEVNATMADPETELDRCFERSELPQSLIDDAVQALIRNRVINTNGKGSQIASAEAGRVDELEKQVAELRSVLQEKDGLSQEQLKRHQARMERRQGIGQQRREAFFAAKKAGKNGDEAMKPFAKLEQDIDVESDEDILADSPKDVVMSR